MPAVPGPDVQPLVERYRLPADAAEKLRALSALVAEDPHAPTTVRDPLAVVRDHLADSLVALDVSEVRAAGSIADLGSGAGFPGLPLAIALPGSAVALVESSSRKCAYLERAVSHIGLSNVTVVNSRAEEWAEGIGGFNLVTARALAPLAVLAEYAAPLLRIGGRLVAWRGQRDLEGEGEAERAAEQLGLDPSEPMRVEPYRGALHRHLHVMVKARQTPAGFPRRAGVAAKRPLGQKSRTI